MMGFGDAVASAGRYCKQSAPRSRQITTPTPHHSLFTRRQLDRMLKENTWCAVNSMHVSFVMFCFSAVCFFIYVSFRAVVLFSFQSAVNTVLLFTVFYCIVSMLINKIFIYSFSINTHNGFARIRN